MSLASQISTVVTRIGTEFKTVYGKLGDLSTLGTSAKGSLVAAINEVNASVAGAGATINDASVSTSAVYSSSKTVSLDTAVQAFAVQRSNHTGTQSADTLTDGSTNKAFLGTERTKLTGIAAGATANSTDAVLLARANHTGTQLASTVSDFSTAADARITAQKGVASGLVPLDGTSKIAATYLPSYVDDVVEYANLAAFPGTGETGKLYIALDSNKEYRWSGSVYVYINPSPGTTDALTEGATNLYFTPARAQAAVTRTSLAINNVDNTSDASKPVSTAQAAADALNLKIASNLADLNNPATARSNLAVFSTTEVGSVTTDFVAVFVAALV